MSTKIGQWAPIALFIYKRPEHVRRTIASLKACPGYDESPLYVFADGPKTEAEIPAVQATRAAARELLGPRAVFVEQDQNRGLANSIIAGTTEICDRHGRVLVVEDDLILAPTFLQFLNDGLDQYQNEPRVMQITGFMFDVPSLADNQEALFLPVTASWGWATWKRAWDQFDGAASGWRERLVGAEAKRFDLGGRYDYSGMLKRQMNGGIDSWAIRWYYSVFVLDGLVLFPPRTLARHEGLDGSGTHGRIVRRVAQVIPPAGEAFSMPCRVTASSAMEDVAEALGRASRRDLGRTVKALVRSRIAAFLVRGRR